MIAWFMSVNCFAVRLIMLYLTAGMQSCNTPLEECTVLVEVWWCDQYLQMIRPASGVVSSLTCRYWLARLPCVEFFIGLAAVSRTLSDNI